MKHFIPMLFCFLCFFSSKAQTIAQLYKQLNASVVTIEVEQKALTKNHKVSYEGSIGSGVIISESGEILTASHVVNDAERINVKLFNGKEIPAKVIRSAPVADLALIKLAWVPENMVVAPLGDSGKTEIGEQVFVVGAPFGLEHSLSVGYISARKEQKARTSGFTITEYFQTDASINTGNSGGPMFNLKGEVIGISSYIISKSGGFQGLGFAATSNLAKKLVVEGQRRWTGIKGFLLDAKMAWMLNVPIKGGMLVESVVNLSPADFAGLKGGFETVFIGDQEVILGGDIILSINGRLLTREVFENIGNVGGNNDSFYGQKTYKLEVLRGGKVEELTLNFK